MSQQSNGENKRSEVRRKLGKTAVAVGATVATGGAAGVAGAASTASATGGAASAATGAGEAANAASAAKNSLSESARELRNAEQRASTIRNALGDKKESSEESDDGSNDFTTNVSGKEKTSALNSFQSSSTSGGSILENIKKRLPLYVITGIIILSIAAFSAMTALYPFHLAANAISKIVNFVATVGDKIRHVFVGDYLKEGEVPEELADNLSECGIDVGTKDEEGSFIKTNKIIASGSEYLIASSDGKFVKASSGTLGVKYKDEFIPYDEVMDKFDTDDDFYNAFNDAVGGDSAFFYDRSGEETLYDLGINRDPYMNFKPTGDQDEDQKAFKKLFQEAIDYDPSNSGTGVGLSGGETPEEEGGNEENDTEASTEESTEEEEEETGGGDPFSSPTGENARQQAKEYIESIANKTKAPTEEEATKKAAALINAAISANEPFQAARAASAVLIGAEQAKAGDGGPVNQLATLLTTTGESGGSGESEEELRDSNSPSSAANLLATVSDVSYSAVAAKEYSRDYVIETTEKEKGDVEKSAINNTVVTIVSGFKSFLSWIVSLFTGGQKANAGYLKRKFTTRVAEALYSKASNSIAGVAMGEKIVEGTAFINTSLAKNTGASNVSDDEAVVAYNTYTKKLYDRTVIAERSRRSPFDISSPNTFFGTIVNNLYSVTGKNSSMFSKVMTLGTLTSKSLGSLVLKSYADEESSSDTYLGEALSESDCATVQSIGGQGDIYCNQIATFDTNEYEGSKKNILNTTLKDYLEGDFKDKLSSYINNDGTVKDETEFTEYIILGAGRESTPGVKDANVCQTKKQGVSIGGLFSFLFGSASEVNNSCNGQDEKIATGEKYGNLPDSEWDSKYKYFQGYYLETYALEVTGYYKAQDKDNPIVAYKNAYYEAHPKDNSFEGIIARRTGWLKEDVIAGLEAINYLAYLESYNPTERYSFVQTTEENEIYFEETNFKADERIAEKKEVIFDRKKNAVVLI